MSKDAKSLRNRIKDIDNQISSVNSILIVKLNQRCELMYQLLKIENKLSKDKKYLDKINKFLKYLDDLTF